MMKKYELPKDIECPYCGQEFDICRDDGHGCEEDEIYEEECPFCEKTFVFDVYISYSYTAHKADCLNGSEHDLQQAHVHPQHWRHWLRCNADMKKNEIHGLVKIGMNISIQ